MAKAKKPLPPPSSSSSGDDSAASSDDEQPPPTTATKPVAAQTQTREESESESESGDESGEDEGKEAPESETRPVRSASEKLQPSTLTPASDAESESESDGKSESESESGDSEPPKLVAPINSRPMPAASPKDSAAEKSNGRALFQRIWTLEDEITLLKGMIQFQSERDPIKPTAAGIEGFHAFIQKKLSLEVVSKSRLLDKVKKLKSKYLAAAARAKSGKPHKFQKPHDESIYELGKKIWVADDDNEGRLGAKSDGGVRSSKRNFPFLKAVAESMGTSFAEKKLSRIDPGKAEVLEQRFKKQKLAEMKHQTREMDLWKETVKLIMEGIERATY